MTRGRVPAALAGRFAADADAVIFDDRERGRAAGLRRSKRRAAAFAAHIGLDLEALRSHAPTTIVVTGSKGKGTAAVYASAALSAAGMRVGTLTSPGLRSNRERIRVDGAAISRVDYAALVARVAAALARHRDELPDDGYLAPTGLFTLAGVRHFLDTECDAWVLEAGMGGASDEASLFAPGCLVLAPVFGEHIGTLGNSVYEIARDKLGAAAAETREVLTMPQSHHEVREALRGPPLVRIVTDDPLRGVSWPPPLVGDNARLGVAAALSLLATAGIAYDEARMHAALRSIRLPGRMSVHARTTQEWRVDAAANGDAVRAALAWSDSRTPAESTLVCIPDGKDRDGVLAALGARPHTALRTDAAHLSFDGWRESLPSLSELDIDALGPGVLALGTVHFVGDVLELLGADTERAYTPPG